MNNPIKNVSMFSTPSDMKSFQNYLANFSGSEAMVAQTCAWMAWNYAGKVVESAIESEDTTKPAITLEVIKESLAMIVETNGYVDGSDEFLTAQCSFIQGLIVADNRIGNYAWLMICIQSGRSILD